MRDGARKVFLSQKLRPAVLTRDSKTWRGSGSFDLQSHPRSCIYLFNSCVVLQYCAPSAIEPDASPAYAWPHCFRRRSTLLWKIEIAPSQLRPIYASIDRVSWNINRFLTGARSDEWCEVFLRGTRERVSSIIGQRARQRWADGDGAPSR